jgi:hypothetical protein
MLLKKPVEKIQLSLKYDKTSGTLQVRRKLQQAVHDWLRSQPKESFSRGIHALPKC